MVHGLKQNLLRQSKFLLAVILCVTLIHVSDAYGKAMLSHKSKTIFRGSTFTLKVNTKKKAKIKASNAKVSIKKSGAHSYKIKGLKAGTSTIKVTVKKKSYTCKVKVNAYINFSIVGYKGKKMMSKKIVYEKGDHAWDILKKSGASLKTKGFGFMLYVKSINGLAEKQHGATSGWMYSINGKAPNVGCNAYKVKAYDREKWYYVTGH